MTKPFSPKELVLRVGSCLLYTSEGTYGGNVVIGDNATLTMTTVAAENTIILGDNVTYQDVYKRQALYSSTSTLAGVLANASRSYVTPSAL